MKRKYIVILLLPIICFITALICADRSYAADVLITNKFLTCRSQGATIVDDYFVYTDYCGHGAQRGQDNNSLTSIYACKLSGNKCGASSKIVTGAKLKHANALDYQWNNNGSFWVFDGWCDPAINGCSGGYQWCYKLDLTKTPISAQKTNQENCGSLTKNKKSSSDRGLSQGYSSYGNYTLKGYSDPNSIYLENGNTRKRIICSGSGELEDVMVNGKTGEIYYTTSKSGWIKLWKVDPSKYSLLSKATGQNDNNDASDAPADDANTINNGGLVVDPTKNQKSEDRTVDTVLFGKIKDDGKGCGVYMVLNLVIDILTGVIGLAAVIGIAIAGITYQSAKGNEAQTTKAKRRIYEIVIGLAAYAVLYAALNWLLPGGKINTSTKCKTACTTQIVEEKLAVSK